jgi:release factor glutamine methyltransferase
VDPPSDEQAAVTRRLAAAGCVAADREAAVLVAAAPDRQTLDRWVARRESGEPLAWITGTTEFCGLRLHVSPGVYVPRAQTETLARRAAALLPAGGRAVDLCTGTGAVAAHLRAEVPDATVDGVDLDPRAAACARRNGGLAIAGDLAEAVRPGDGWDLVTAVAPYVPTADLRYLPVDVRDHEPRAALDGGHDGLDLVRRVVIAAARLLRQDGWLVLEVGGGQDQTIAPALAAAGFGRPEPWHDPHGDLRGLATRRAPG